MAEPAAAEADMTVTMLGYLVDFSRLVGKRIKVNGEWREIKKVKELFRSLLLTLDDDSTWKVSLWAHVEIDEAAQPAAGVDQR